MALNFLPRHFQSSPAQTFWLRDDTVISSRGPLAKRSEARFRQRLYERLGQRWAPGRAGGKQPSGRITFRAYRRATFLQAIQASRTAPAVPVLDAGFAGAEAFRLEVRPDSIQVEACSEIGFRHAEKALFDQFDLFTRQFAGGLLEDEPAFPFRAFLLSLAHSYKAPRQGETRTQIEPFDPLSAEVLLKRIADARFNAIIVDVENAVQYRSHPQLTHSHTHPMSAFERLVEVARGYGLEVIPKTNFSKSEKHRHNDWFEPYHLLQDGPEYFRRAGQVMDELIAIARPRYYHIGMDEDHRPAGEYVAAVLALRQHLLRRRITPIMWIDVNKYQPEIDEKMWTALKSLPRQELIINFWQYHGRGFDQVGTLRKMGYTVLCATFDKNDAIRALALRSHQQKAAGMVGTRWIPLTAETLAEYSRTCGVSGRAFWTGG